MVIHITIKEKQLKSFLIQSIGSYLSSKGHFGLENGSRINQNACKIDKQKP
jgi:hypothetical protein